MNATLKTDRRKPAPTGARAMRLKPEAKSHAPVEPAERELEALIHARPSTNNHDKAAWEFLQRVKGLPRYENSSLTEIESILKQWHHRWGQHLRQRLFEDTWARGIEAWEAIKFPKRMESIIKKANASSDPPEASQFEDSKKTLLLRLLRELQRDAKLRGEAEFYLASETAGTFVGVDKATAWRWLTCLFRIKGLLEVVATGGRPKDGKAMASTYRYLGELR
jgi:hypothetical protein